MKIKHVDTKYEKAIAMKVKHYKGSKLLRAGGKSDVGKLKQAMSGWI